MFFRLELVSFSIFMKKTGHPLLSDLDKGNRKVNKSIC